MWDGICGFPHFLFVTLQGDHNITSDVVCQDQENFVGRGKCSGNCGLKQKFETGLKQKEFIN